MIAGNKNQCELAKEYYYDMLDPDTLEQVPENIQDHIANCLYCIRRLAQLHQLLSDSALRNQKEPTTIRQKPTQLARHFPLHEAQVDCTMVKEFLPLLVEPGPGIKIPAIVTMHLDQCPQCNRDFETLRSLKLNSKQLATLAEFFSRGSFQNSFECSGVSKSIKAVAEMRFGQVTADTLKHICLCKQCRNSVYTARLTMSEKVPGIEKPASFPCKSVGAADLFVYCLPYGLDPANDEHVKFRESLTSHLRKCPKCLEKMRQLHNTLYSIAERGKSGVVTCYELDSPAKKTRSSNVDEPYADRPINVQQLNKSRPVPDIIVFPQRLKQRLSTINMKQFIKLAAVAALILTAAALFFNAPAGKAVDLGQIYEAISEITNVCKSSFVPGKTRPIQEVWVSITNGFRLLHDGKTFVLWDFANNTKKVKTLENNTVQVTTLSADTVSQGKKSLKSSFGLVPFPDITDVPEAARWEQVADESSEATIPDAKVYDLSWPEKGRWFHKWRFFIEPTTNLPKRVECYKKTVIEHEYELKSVHLVEYPSDNSIEAIIRNAFD
ncbi:MAG: hypothetical protein OEW48_13950 [Phycisphaerae bacterium]|nr:hypothetical protein [Phycisphaerae bacterium]